MNRRDMLIVGASAGLLAATHASLADTPKGDPKKPPAPGKPDPRQALLDALATCAAKSLACLAHCEAQFAAGNKEFARCGSAATDMIAIAPVVQNLVVRKSSVAKKAVELCVAACKDCAAACAEHKAHFAQGMHVECKECLEACEACDKACAAFLAA
jgi:Cys-rich four helix bundle protein (predicted Tat secretion target)